MSGIVRVLPDPLPPETVSRFAWIWLEARQPRIGFPYATEAEARRIGKPPGHRAALLELVLPRDEVLAAIRADTPDE